MTYLILVRHGESRWNLTNKFTGWTDVPLSEKGIKEAISCSKKLKALKLEYAFTSKLVRAQETLLLILAKQKYTGIFVHKEKKSKHKKEKNEIPIYSNKALNERHYGKLQGMNKDKARKRFGKEKVFKWRRSWDIKPPKGESLKDVYKRVIPYFNKQIKPKLKKGDIIISAHGNSLRALIKYLDNISNDKLPFLEIPFGNPIIYKYSKGKLIKTKKHSFKRPIKWKK